MASASIKNRALLRLIGAALALLWWASVAVAHPMPESLVWIDTTPNGMNITAQLPLNRLEFSFGRTLTDHPELVLERYGNALSAYLLNHVGARSQGKGWQVLRPELEIVGPLGSEELQATFVLRAPPGADARAPELVYDVITHEVRTHRVQVFLRNDWESGFAAQAPLLIGELNHARNTLFIPLGEASAWSGFTSLFEGGIEHIAQGTDHLLFLLMLLLVAPLAVTGSCWGRLRPWKETLKHTTFVITAFTVGHTITLVLGSTGTIAAPSRLVEVAVAITIAIAAVHAWRPLFVHAETSMALCFGLIHGLAFSSSLSGAGLTHWQHAQALLGFNLGIETMQLMAVIAVLPPLLALGIVWPVRSAHLRRMLALFGGAMACAWVVQRTELVDLGDPAWLGDGGAMPITLIGVLWLAALTCLAVARLRVVMVR